MINKIIDAAAVCFSKNGYHETSVDDIAKTAGVAKGSIYYHFKNKSDLFYHVMKMGTDMILDMLEKENHKDQEITVMLNHIITSCVNLCLDYPELASVLFNEPTEGLDEDLLGKINQLENVLIEKLSHLLKSGAEINVIKKDLNYELVATGLMGMLSSTCLRYIKTHSSIKKEDLCYLLIELISSGILA